MKAASTYNNFCDGYSLFAPIQSPCFPSCSVPRRLTSVDRQHLGSQPSGFCWGLSNERHLQETRQDERREFWIFLSQYSLFPVVLIVAKFFQSSAPFRKLPFQASSSHQVLRTGFNFFDPSGLGMAMTSCY